MRKDIIPVNKQIKAQRIILIDEAGIKMGEFMRNDAIEAAQERGFDLVQVGGSDDRPTCKMMDYGKYLYDKKKKMKKNPSATVKVKEITLRPNTDDHDFMVRVKQAEKFLSQGNKVKLTVKFKGREGAHLDIVRERCLEFADKLASLSEIESKPSRFGRGMMMILAPKNHQ